MRLAAAVVVGFLISIPIMAILHLMGFASDPDPDVRLGAVGVGISAWAFISCSFGSRGSHVRHHCKPHGIQIH
ncbi:MAG TPA: hypothetical protein VJ815_10910 [Acidimicrobiia bacterium]|nr:hypothetical protein [Acidimicrobiia bacterium]